MVKIEKKIIRTVRKWTLWRWSEALKHGYLRPFRSIDPKSRLRFWKNFREERTESAERLTGSASGGGAFALVDLVLWLWALGSGASQRLWLARLAAWPPHWCNRVGCKNERIYRIRTTMVLMVVVFLNISLSSPTFHSLIRFLNLKYKHFLCVRV